jgi:ribosomal protein S12 methylthiotransferase
VAKISLISLGCPKNLVDSEHLLKQMREEGMGYSMSPEEADIIMVNTCGFIEAAKKESIEEILNLAQLKEGDIRKKLVVFGCLAQRYGEELNKEIPEIDALWGLGRERDILEYCKKISAEIGDETPSSCISTDSIGTELLFDKPYAYLKIAEGCDRNCSYCVIPAIRGNFRSIDPEQILAEAEGHIQSGKKELILISQDNTAYGKDREGYSLSRLVRDIASLQGEFWIRLLYLYPTSITDELIETIGSEDKVCKYIDMPLQHISEKILKHMGRGGSRKLYKKLISKIRERVPDVNLRTTVIVGFPQETDKEFHELVEFIQDTKFERLGVFCYSREEGSPAYKLKGQVPQRIKIKRFHEIMKIQSGISLEKNKLLVGRTFRALVDETDGKIAVARLSSQSPDIDGVVLIQDSRVKKGTFADVTIDDAYDYDLKGTIIR